MDPGAIDEKHLRRPLSMQSILLSADSSLPSSSSSSSSSSSAPTEDRVPAHLLDTPRWRAAPLPDDPNLENGTIGVPILPLPTLLRKSARRVDAEGKQIGRDVPSSPFVFLLLLLPLVGHVFATLSAQSPTASRPP